MGQDIFPVVGMHTILMDSGSKGVMEQLELAPTGSTVPWMK